MGFKALTVNTAAEAAGHIYAEDDAAIFQSMFGGDGVLNIGNCLKSTVISNNKVRISDGVLSVGGHIGRLSHADYQDMTIENGATGYNRNDIIYARFLTSGNVDSFILAVKKGTATTGTASDPALVQGNLYEGAVERDYPLYRVKLSGLSIASVDQLFTVIPTIPDLKAQMAKDKAEINQSLNNLTTIATLWEHPNFSNTANFQEFAPQTLSIANLGNYDIIGICHSCYDRTRCRFNFIPNILNAQQVLDITWNSNASGYEFRAYQRNFKISGNEIIFYDGYSVRNGTREKNNSFAIPIKIIGIKLK